MISKEKRAIVLSALSAYGAEGATCTQLAKVLRRTNSGIAAYMRDLMTLGDVVMIEVRSRGAKAYAVTESGREGAVAEKDVFESCRENWQGYKIHKVFGAGGAVRL